MSKEGVVVAGGCGALILLYAFYFAIIAGVIWLAATIVHHVFF